MNHIVEKVGYEWRMLPTKGGRLPATRINSSAFVFGRAIWQIGGIGGGVGRTSEVWRYELEDGQWCLVANKGHDNPPTRDGHTATPIGGGAVLMFGGQGSPQPNEKSERNHDVVRTKTYLIRDLYNDLYKWDCQQEQWTMMCPEGGVPLCRRGHSAVFVPFGAYSHSTLAPPEGLVEQHAGKRGNQGNQGGNGGSSSSSPAASRKQRGEPFLPIPENSVVVFGGSGMEVSKYIEAVYNDLWVYNVDVGRWSKQRTRGAEPKPLFDHRAERVGEILVIVGGITSTNAKPFVSDEPPVENNDVIILNLQTATWSVLEFFAPHRKPSRLNLHGFSLAVDPFSPNSGILFLFGGKDTIDGKRAAHESAAGAKRLLKKAKGTNFTLQIDLHKCLVTQVDYKGSAPERRYQHVGVALHDDELTKRPKLMPRMTVAGVKLPPPVEEPVMMIFGGAKVEQGGYCDNVLYQLVRTRAYIDTEVEDAGESVHEDAHSVASGAASVHDSSVGSVGHPVDPHEDFHEDEDDNDRPASIWEKVQKQHRLAGEETRDPSTWAELKLALSTSLTEKHFGQTAKSMAAGTDISAHSHHASTSRLPSVVNGSSVQDLKLEAAKEAPAAVATSSFAKALEAKKQMQKIRALSASVLPLVKGKHLSFIKAKETYLQSYPPQMMSRSTMSLSSSIATENPSQSAVLTPHEDGSPNVPTRATK